MDKTTTTQKVTSTTEESFHASKNDEKKLLGGGRHTIGGLSFDDTKAVADDRNLNRFGGLPSMAPTVQEEHSTPFSVLLNTKNGENSKNYDPLMENFFCSPTMVRNLFWNVTRAGDVNVQPCPGKTSLICNPSSSFTISLNLQVAPLVSLSGDVFSPLTLLTLMVCPISELHILLSR